MPGLVVSPMKCATCGQITVFEITPPAPGKSKSFAFRCAYGDHLATNAQGGAEIVDLTNYDQSKLKKVRI
jgi:hypothetical protein